mmetsp:Transcript_121275/g.213821  ORF Transcript_121275/g.213821 Transcript_121275/m.213821 type:complete len:984 (-) Transcript_121275:57-3008(-)
MEEEAISSESAQRQKAAKLLGTPDLTQGSSWDYMFGPIFDAWHSLQLLGRRLRVYYVAWYARRRYTQAEARAEVPGLTKEEQAAIWDETHAYVAGMVCGHILVLEGLWVKLGQYMSTRADILPDVWVSHLLQLQDAVPPKSFSDVHATLVEEFGKARRSAKPCGCGRSKDVEADEEVIWPFERIDENPLGTASIAQVHRAWLIGGDQVVVKVQHRGVEDIILQDLDNAAYLVAELAKSKPEYDFRDILNEWCAETKKEVDFIHEADNTERVAANLRNLTGIKLPRVIRCTPSGIPVEPTRKVLVLEYIDGVKPTDRNALSSWGVRGDQIMERLSAAFAHQVFVDGLFNGDPHPGNMLIERGTGMPVLLDFGLVKELPTDTRVAFCRLILAAADSDFTGLLQALKEMGLSKHVSLANPEEAMEAVQYMFRDAAPDVNARRRSTHNRDISTSGNRYDAFEEELPPPTGGHLPPFPASLLTRGASARGHGGSTQGVDSSQLLSTPLSRGKSEATGKRYPVEATPGTVIFLLRVVSCLRGIAVSLGCQHSYLAAFAPYARQALRASLLASTSPAPILPARTPLEAELRKVASQLCSAGDALGLQVVVFRRGVLEAELAWGEMGPLDPRPMQSDSLISAFSCGKALAVLLVHVLVDKGLLASLDDPVCRYWPAFASSGKECITVRQVLEHRAGLAYAMPSFASDKGVGAAVRELCNFGRMRNWIATARPDRSQMGKAEYHAVTHGWLVAGLAEKIAQAHDKRWTYEALVRELILLPLGIIQDVAVRIPEAEDKVICNGQNLETRLTSVGVSAKVLPKDGSGDMLGDMSSGMSALEEMGMDPRVFNDASLRSSLLPAVNTHWTARGLATMYSALAFDGAIPGKGRVLSQSYCRRLQAEVASAQGPDLWPCGFRRMKVATSADNRNEVLRGFGFPGLYNNMAYADPAEGLGVAILVNQLDTEGIAAREVLETIARVLRVARHTMDGLGVS